MESMNSFVNSYELESRSDVSEVQKVSETILEVSCYVNFLIYTPIALWMLIKYYSPMTFAGKVFILVNIVLIAVIQLIKFMEVMKNKINENTVQLGLIKTFIEFFYFLIYEFMIWNLFVKY